MQTPIKPNRPRAREISIQIGVLPTGELNGMTDVPGVKVGHVTRIVGRRTSLPRQRSNPHRCDSHPAARWQYFS